MQFCTPNVRFTGSQDRNGVGRGVYTTNGQPVAADLLLTFVNSAASPQAVIVILPIYVTNSQEPNLLSTLLQQKSTVGSLTGLFNENSRSYGYNICISTVVDAQNLSIYSGINTYIVSFPGGYSMPQADINQLKNLPDYTFRPAQGHPIVTAFGFDSETNSYPPNQIDSGTFYCTYVAGNDEKVSNHVTNYAQSPTHTQWKSAQSAQFTLDQYKCYPLNDLQNLKDASGIVMPDAIKSLKSASPENSGFSAGILMVLWSLFGIAVVGALIVIISYFVTPDEVPAAVLAAVAPVAATS